MASYWSSVLDAAITNYVDSLPDSPSGKTDLRQELETTTPEVLLEQLKVIQTRFSTSSRFLKLVDRMNPCIKQIQRFTKVTEICIQSKPEAMCLIWGGLKFLLQVASEFREFFEKLLRMIEQMSDVLPNYEQYLEYFDRHDDILRERMVIVYKHILDFWRQATGIFVKRTGSGKTVQVTTRPALSIVGSILWKPFDDRFGDMIRSFSDQCRFIQSRLQTIAAAEILKKLRNATDWQNQMLEDAKRNKEAFEAEREVTRCEREADMSAREINNDFQKIVKEFMLQSAHTRGLDEVEREERLRLEVQRWLNPPTYDQIQKYAGQNRQSDTGQWLLTFPQYQKWSQLSRSGELEQHERLLWIKGKPGCGKTVLATLVIEELQARSACEESNLVYYFCDWREARKSGLTSLLSALLSQFLVLHRFNTRQQVHETSDTALLDAFALIMRESTSNTACTKELWQLLRVCLRHYPQTYFVIDGLDECTPDDCKETAEKFSLISREVQQARVAIFGRSEDRWLRHCLNGHPHVHIIPNCNNADIEAYASARLDTLLSLGFGSRFSLTLEDIIRRLVLGSNGMFLWIRLVMDVLSSRALSPDARAQLFYSVTVLEGLDQLYTRILDYVCSQAEPDRKLAEKILMWVSYAEWPLNLEELQIGVVQREKKLDDGSYIPDFAEIAFIVCGGLVELEGSGNVQYIHLSVREFLHTTQHLQFRKKFFQYYQLGITNLQMAETCLDYLIWSVPLEPLHLTGKLSKFSERLPFVRYASLSWDWHFLKSYNSLLSTSKDLIVGFISKALIIFQSREKLLVLLEAMYSFEGSEYRACQQRLCHLQSSLEGLPQAPPLQHCIGQLIRDMDTLEESFPDVIHNKQHLLWSGITDFLSPDSLLNENPSNMVECRPEAPQVVGETFKDEEDIFDKEPILTSSRLVQNGSVLCLVSIWVPQTFGARMRAKCTDLGDITKYATGWAAVVEQWNTHSFEKYRSPLQIALEPAEVAYHIRPFILSNHSWEDFGIPITISSDLSMIFVMSTIYHLPNFSRQDVSVQKTLNVFGEIALKTSTSYEDCKAAFSNDNRYLAYRLSTYSSIEPRSVNAFSQSNECHIIAVYELSDGKRPSRLWKYSYAPKNPIWCLDVAIHPEKPFLAWSSTDGTFLVNFGTMDFTLPENAGKERPGYCLDHDQWVDMHFSACGYLLCGMKFERPVEPYILDNYFFDISGNSQQVPRGELAKRTLISSLSAPNSAKNSQSNGKILMSSNTSIIGGGSGSNSRALYQLRTNHEGNETGIVRKDMAGNVDYRPLANLPKSSVSQTQKVEVVMEDLPASEGESTTITFVQNSSSRPSISSQAYPRIYRKRYTDLGAWNPNKKRFLKSSEASTEERKQ